MEMKYDVGKTTRHAVLALTLAGLAATSADAQRLAAPGFTRSDQSDVTGPAVTSGDQLAAMFTEPGTVLSMFCPVAWGVRSSANTVQTRLTSANLQSALPVGSQSIGSTAQLVVLNLMTTRNRDAAGPVLGALVYNNDTRSAQRNARRLTDELSGLFLVVDEMDPLEPGAVAPTRLGRAVGAYNAFIGVSSEAFLLSPPQALAAIHSVLNQMVIASLENEGRAADPNVVDAAGLACAVIAPPAPAPPPPPVEQAISMCVLVETEFRNVAALRRPEQGDTVVIVGGDRRLIAEVYPNVHGVNSPPWVPLGEPVTIGTTQYQPFGVSMIVAPGAAVRHGTIQGFDYFAAPGAAAAPTEIYFPVGPNCEVQPYRSVETIRVRG